MKFIKYICSALVLCAAISCAKSEAPTNKTQDPISDELENVAFARISEVYVSFKTQFIPDGTVKDFIAGAQLEPVDSVQFEKFELLDDCVAPGVSTNEFTFQSLPSEIKYKFRTFKQIGRGERVYTKWEEIVTNPIKATISVTALDEKAVTDTSATLAAKLEYDNEETLPADVDFYYAKGEGISPEDLEASGTKLTKKGAAAGSVTISTYDKKAKVLLEPETSYCFMAVVTVKDVDGKTAGFKTQKSQVFKSYVAGFKTAAVEKKTEE